MFNFPQTAPIVKTLFAPKTQMKDQWPKKPKTINLLESWLEDEFSMR